MAQRVLIVENTEDFRVLLREIVEGLGYEAITVNRATAALTVLQAEIISLILLDIKMPALYGDDLLRFIRKKGNRTPVVVVSGFLTPDVLQGLRAAGVHQVIAKPFKVRRLAQAMAEVLEKVA